MGPKNRKKQEKIGTGHPALVAEYGLLFLYRVSVIKPSKGWVVISGHNNLTNETYIFTPFPVGGNQSGYIHFNLIKIGSL